MNEYLKGPKPGISLKKVFNPNRFIVGGAYHVKTGKSHKYNSYACLLNSIHDDELWFVYIDPKRKDDDLMVVIKIWEYESGDVTITHLTEGNVV